MSDRSITFLEVHLGDSRIQFGPKRIGNTSESTNGSDAEPAETPPSVDRSPIRTAGGILVAIGVVLAIGAVIWTLLVGNQDLDDAVELDELS